MRSTRDTHCETQSKALENHRKSTTRDLEIFCTFLIHSCRSIDKRAHSHIEPDAGGPHYLMRADNFERAKVELGESSVMRNEFATLIRVFGLTLLKRKKKTQCETLAQCSAWRACDTMSRCDRREADASLESPEASSAVLRVPRQSL